METILSSGRASLQFVLGFFGGLFTGWMIAILGMILLGLNLIRALIKMPLLKDFSCFGLTMNRKQSNAELHGFWLGSMISGGAFVIAFSMELSALIVFGV